MANDYYTVKRGPRSRQRSRADVVTAELNSIEDGFDGLPSRNVLAGSAHLLAVETAASAADVYVLLSEHPITSLLTGQTTRFFVTNTNTGGCTVNVDGTGVKDLTNADGTALVANSIVAGRLAEIVYNGAQWRLLNSAKASTVSIALSSALAPQNYQRNVAISALTLPAATGGTAPYTYAATGLPTGLLFALLTRIVSGTPTAIGTSNVTYTVTDANGNSFAYQFQIRVVESPIQLAAPAARTLTVGSAYTFTLPAAMSGTSPYAYTLGNLPDGLAFDEETREVSGSPESDQVGLHTVSYAAADSGTPQQTIAQDFVLTIRSASALSLGAVNDLTFEPGSSITPFTLPAANGGVPTYTYIVTGLGEGLIFNPATREVSGTPNTEGERQVTYRVEDVTGSQVERQFVITIQPFGNRYIAVSEDQTISATDLQAGNSYGSTEQSLTLPEWVGNRYIVIAQPSSEADLTSISLAGLGNSISDFDKQSYTRTIDTIDYEIWVSTEVQGDVIAGEIIEVRP